MKSSVIAIIIVVSLVAVGVFLYFASSSDDGNTVDNRQSVNIQSNESATAENATPTQEQAELSQITLEQVSQRSSATDCWTIIDGSVYDITSYVPRHPGGDEILLACGTDGSSLFNQRTTADGQEIGSGTPHSSSAARQLQAYKIGELAN